VAFTGGTPVPLCELNQYRKTLPVAQAPDSNEARGSRRQSARGKGERARRKQKLKTEKCKLKMKLNNSTLAMFGVRPQQNRA
jgi:hypothetical protein